MTTSYPEFSTQSRTNVNWSLLPLNCISFYRWVHRWYHQTGEVSPSTDYLARKQKRTERTIYRWLALLEAAGAIEREVIHGIERSIIPLVEPPPKFSSRGVPPPPSTSSKKDSKSLKSHYAVRGLSCIDAYTHDSTSERCVESPVSDIGGLGLPQSQSAGESTDKNTAPATERSEQSKQENPPRRVLGNKLAADVAAVGVAVPVAVDLVATEPEKVAEQLAALPYRRAKDRAAVLVASVRQSWPLPAAFLAAVEQHKKAMARAQNDALRAELSKKRKEARESVSASFSGLPEPVRAELLDRAAAALRSELPAVWRMMQNRPDGVRASWVASRALKLLQAGDASK